MNTLYQTVKQYRTAASIVLISKILILFFLGPLSTYIFSNSRAANLNVWELWNVWDAPHYISVASSGYQKVGDEANFIIYLPFLPLLISIFKLLSQTSFLISGYIVSFTTSVLLAIILYKLTLLDYPKKTALLTILMLFIFPTAFFLHIPYTESLFIMLAVTSFYFIRTRRYLLGFLFAGFASFTKVAGLALLPAIFAEILIYDKSFFQVKRLNNRIIFLMVGFFLSISGFLLYLLWNYLLWGDFLYFTAVQKQHWNENFAPFGQGLISTFQSLSWRIGLEKLLLGYAQIAAFILGLLMSIYVLVKIRFSYGLFMIVVLWFSYSMSFWVCMPRYILSLFPMFIALALLSKHVLFKYAWILFSAILLVTFALIFIQHGPVL